MKRLTTNKKVNEMSMFELAHNSCYIKDREARYRDYDKDIDARQLAIRLLDKLAGVPNEFTCDDDFDEFIANCLPYFRYEDSIGGLIAVFYRNMWAMADLREKLKEYEDLEEKERLLKLPCAVGNKVYAIEADEEKFEHFHCGMKISQLEFDYWMIPLFGKCIFLTRQEAKNKLAEMEGKK